MSTESEHTYIVSHHCSHGNGITVRFTKYWWMHIRNGLRLYHQRPRNTPFRGCNPSFLHMGNQRYWFPTMLCDSLVVNSKSFWHETWCDTLPAAPYHPATSGLVERMVQTYKGLLKKSMPGDIETDFAVSMPLSHDTTFHYQCFTCRVTTRTPTQYTSLLDASLLYTSSRQPIQAETDAEMPILKPDSSISRTWHK